MDLAITLAAAFGTSGGVLVGYWTGLFAERRLNNNNDHVRDFIGSLERQIEHQNNKERYYLDKIARLRNLISELRNYADGNPTK